MHCLIAVQKEKHLHVMILLCIIREVRLESCCCSVKNVMHTKIPYVASIPPINDVIYRISDFSVGMTLVKDDDDNVVGIVTDGDIRKKMLQVPMVKKSTAADYMTEGFVSIDANKRNSCLEENGVA